MIALTKFVLAGAVFSASMLASSAMADDEGGAFSANIGFATEYYYRGILQKESSANGGVDYENGGFYVGTWAADVGDGLEVDGYFGYGFEFENGFSAGLGFTGYYYTGEFDDTYEEINLNLAYDLISLEHSVGSYENFGGQEQDYAFTALTLEKNGFYVSYATFSDDFDGDYIELGYGTEVAGVDLGVSVIFNSEELSDQCDSAGTNIDGSCLGSSEEGQAFIFSISKSFEL